MIEVCDCHALPTVALDGTVIMGAATACALKGAQAEVEAASAGRPCSAAAAAVVAGSSPPAALRVLCPASSPIAGLTPHLPLTAGPAVIAAARARAGGAGGCECAQAGLDACSEHSPHSRGGGDTPGGGDSAGTECDMLMEAGGGSGGGGSGGGGGESPRGG